MPPTNARTETEALLTFLNNQREHVLGILDGVDEETLRRPILPPGWSCLGLVQHLALDVERFWFGAVIAGDQAVIKSLADVGNAWTVDPAVPAGSILDQYRRESDRANVILQSASLEAAPRWWPEDAFGDWRLHTIREVALHVVTESAAHAGHLDAARELIDGKLWLVLT